MPKFLVCIITGAGGNRGVLFKNWSIVGHRDFKVFYGISFVTEDIAIPKFISILISLFYIVWGTLSSVSIILISLFSPKYPQ